MNHLKKYKDLYLLNYLLITIYFIFFTSLGINVREGIMFTTYDSTTYWNTSTEFYKFSETGFSSIRPFLYPLIILIVCKAFGVFGLWIMQLLFWIISINLIFFSIKRITKNRILAYAGSLIMALNFSYIGLTMQCLTEVTALLLISILIYFVSSNAAKTASLKFFHGSLFILILLAVLKPVFFVPVLLMLFVILPFFYFKKYLQNPKNLIILFLAAIPLLLQMTIMKVKYDSFSVSKISSETFRSYILAQGVKQNDNTSWEDTRLKTKNFSSSDVISYIAANKSLYLNIYIQNLQANMNAFPSFLLGPRRFIYPGFLQYMTVINTLYYYLHIIFIIPLFITIYAVYKRKEMNYYFILLVIPLFLMYYIFLTSPVSFGEGDRLIITSLPIWVFLYALTLNYIFKSLQAGPQLQSKTLA